MKGLRKQEERVLAYLEKNGWVSNMELSFNAGIGSPTKVISDMIKDGVAIEKMQCVGVNRYGEKVHYTKYRLGDE